MSRVVRAIAYSALLLAGLSLAGLLQSQANLTYQNRGRYFEGLRTAPSTGPSLDLIAALVDYREPYTNLPPKFQALFYLPKPGPVFVTIREVEARYFYWLDKVQQESGWQTGKRNGFEWPTGTVIQSLNWKGSPLALDDLGATARLGSSTPGKVEEVLPVALYHSIPPRSVEGYCFIFRPGARMRLRFEVFAEGKRLALENQSFPSVLAGEPHWVKWKAEDWPDGWYRLVVNGYALSDNAPIDATVRFYHARQLGN